MNYAGLLTRFLFPLLQYHQLSKAQPAALESRTAESGIQAAWLKGGGLQPPARESLFLSSFFPPFLPASSALHPPPLSSHLLTQDSLCHIFPFLSLSLCSYRTLPWVRRGPSLSSDPPLPPRMLVALLSPDRAMCRCSLPLSQFPQWNFESVHLHSSQPELRDHMQP